MFACGMQGRRLVAINIKRLRVSRALSQERLANDAGLERRYVGGIERGQENPTIDTLDKLAAALQVHVSLLLQEPPANADMPRGLRPGRRRSRS